MSFQFDKDKSPADNVTLFFEHLEASDKEFAQILRANITELIPFPADGQTRMSSRVRANNAIRKTLDTTTP